MNNHIFDGIVCQPFRIATYTYKVYFECCGIPCIVESNYGFNRTCDLCICDGWRVRLWETEQGWQTTMPGLIDNPYRYRTAWHAAYSVLRMLRGQYYIPYMPIPLQEAFKEMRTTYKWTERRHRISFLREIAKAIAAKKYNRKPKLKEPKK